MPLQTKPHCLCVPEIPFVCDHCKEMGQEPVNPSEDSLPDLTGYGHIAADQDGGNGEEISPIEHKETEMLIAVREIFKAEEI